MNTLHRNHPHRRAQDDRPLDRRAVAAISLGGRLGSAHRRHGRFLSAPARATSRPNTGLQNNTFAFIIAADQSSSPSTDMVVLAA